MAQSSERVLSCCPSTISLELIGQKIKEADGEGESCVDAEEEDAAVPFFSTAAVTDMLDGAATADGAEEDEILLRSKTDFLPMKDLL